MHDTRVLAAPAAAVLCRKQQDLVEAGIGTAAGRLRRDNKHLASQLEHVTMSRQRTGARGHHLHNLNLNITETELKLKLEHKVYIQQPPHTSFSVGACTCSSREMTLNWQITFWETGDWRERAAKQ